LFLIASLSALALTRPALATPRGIQIVVFIGGAAPDTAGDVITDFGPDPLRIIPTGVSFIGSSAPCGLCSNLTGSLWVSDPLGTLRRLFSTGQAAPTTRTEVLVDALEVQFSPSGSRVEILGVTNGSRILVHDDGAGGLVRVAEASNGGEFFTRLPRGPGEACCQLLQAIDPSFRSIAIANDGRSAFSGTMLVGSGGVDSSNDSGLWGEDATGALRRFAREGDAVAVPGSPSSILEEMGDIAVDSKGIVFRSGNSAGSTLLYEVDANGKVSLLVEPGSLLPAGQVVSNVLGFSTNDSGQIALFAEDSDFSSPIVFVDTEGSVSRLAYKTLDVSAITGWAGETISSPNELARFPSTAAPILNASGTVLFRAEIEPPSEDALWAADPSGALDLIMRTGTPVSVENPGMLPAADPQLPSACGATGPGWCYSGFLGTASLNDAGDALLAVTISQGGPQSKTSDLLVYARASDGRKFIVARTGQLYRIGGSDLPLAVLDVGNRDQLGEPGAATGPP